MNDEELKEKYLLKGYPKLETSTVALIKEAIKQGINYEIIDEDRSFIKLYNNNNKYSKRSNIIWNTKNKL